MGISSFIVENRQALSKEGCEKIIDFFESSKKHHEKGRVGGADWTVDPQLKASTDMYCNFNSSNFVGDKNKGEDKINLDLLKAVCDTSVIYKETYPQTTTLTQWQVRTGYNLQKYEPLQGYFHEHCEHDSFDSPRVMVWMIYLNDVEDGGTHFPYQNMLVKAEQGKCVMWPAYFTHMHRGQPSFKNTKYIATGWFVYSAGCAVSE